MSLDAGGDEEAAGVWPGDHLVLAPPPTVAVSTVCFGKTCLNRRCRTTKQRRGITIIFDKYSWFMAAYFRF